MVDTKWGFSPRLSDYGEITMNKKNIKQKGNEVITQKRGWKHGKVQGKILQGPNS